MLFEFITFVEELKENPAKKWLVEKYSSLVEPLDNVESFESLRLYKDYLSLLPAFPYSVPDELKNDFDWDLLLQLIMSSFSGTVDIAWSKNNDLLDVYITVSTTDDEGRITTTVKTISELWSFQILRLFEIYVLENLEMQCLRSEDKSELSIIDEDRRERIVKAKMLKLKYSKLKAMASLKGK